MAPNLTYTFICKEIMYYEMIYGGKPCPMKSRGIKNMADVLIPPDGMTLNLTLTCKQMT